MKKNLIITQDNARAFEQGISMLNLSMREMRKVVRDIAPKHPLTNELDDALRELCQDFERERNLIIQYSSVGLEKLPPSNVAANSAFRMVSELLSHSVKQTSALRLLVQVSYAEVRNNLSITLKDDAENINAAIDLKM